MTCLLLAMALQRDPAAGYRAFVERLRTAQTVVGHVEVTMYVDRGKSVFNDRFAFQKPNLARVELWRGENYYGLNVSDGTYAWQFDAVQGRLQRLSAPEQGFLDDEFFLEPFLEPTNRSLDFLPIGEPAKRTHFHGHYALDLAVGYGGKRKEGDEAHVFLDPATGAPIGFSHYSAKHKMREEAQIFEIKVGGPIDQTLFAYHPTLAFDKGAQKSTLVPIGTKALSFEGALVGGKRFSFTQTARRSRAMVLDFWGVGCSPCRKQLQELQSLQDRYGDKGLQVVTVDLFDAERSLADFAKENHISLPIVLVRSCSPDVVYGYKATLEPTTYLIDSNGRIAGRYVSDDLGELRRDLAKLGFP